MVETRRSEILEQRIVEMLMYRVLTSAARKCSHTGGLPEVMVWPEKQHELMRSTCIVQFVSLYITKY